jgi:hypothetical protein
MLLSEIFSSTYTWHLQSRNCAEFVTADGSSIEVSFFPLEEQFSGEENFPFTGIDVMFSRNLQISLTGSGDSVKIFSTVIAILKDVVSKRDPDIIFFSCKKSDKSRLSFYTKLVKRFMPTEYIRLTSSRKIKNEHLEDLVDQLSLSDYYENFFLIKKSLFYKFTSLKD